MTLSTKKRTLIRMEILTLAYVRAHLRAVLDRVTAGEVVAVGAHRAPEVVLLAEPAYARLTNRSSDVMPTLLSMASARTAHLMLAEGRAASWVPGDSFGRVVGWLWDTGQSRAMTACVADLLADLRHHDPKAPEPGARLTLEELLHGLALSLPYGSATEPIVEKLRREVPKYFSTDDVTQP